MRTTRCMVGNVRVKAEIGGALALDRTTSTGNGALLGVVGACTRVKELREFHPWKASDIRGG